MNVGAVLILPDGFKMAPTNLIPSDIKAKTKNTYIQPYSTDKSNILVVGPMPSNQNQTITFPILSPDPLKDKNVHFLKYPIYAGGNRGRGQVYPSGEKSNNNPILSANLPPEGLSPDVPLAVCHAFPNTFSWYHTNPNTSGINAAASIIKMFIPLNFSENEFKRYT